jgi:hypothetical protein
MRAAVSSFFHITASRPALVPTQPAIQLVPGAISPRLKRPEREANSSPPSSAEAKNSWIYNFHSRMRLHGELLSKAQGQFTVYILTLNLIFCSWNKLMTKISGL